MGTARTRRRCGVAPVGRPRINTCSNVVLTITRRRFTRLNISGVQHLNGISRILCSLGCLLATRRSSLHLW